MKKNSIRNRKLLVLALILAFLAGFMLTPVFAAEAQAKVTYQDSSKKSSTSSKKTERYFSDVKSKKSYKSEIEWLAKRQAYQGIAKQGKKFKPNAIITRKQVGIVLDNLYGDAIDITISNPSGKATQKFVTNILTEVSDQLGYRIKWSGGAPKGHVSRAKFSHYLYSMIKLCKTGKLDPRVMKTQ